MLRFRDRVLRFRSWVLRFRVLGASFSRFRCFVFEFWVLRFRDLGASFSSFGCFVFELGCFVFEFWVPRFRVLGASFSNLGASFSNFGCFVLRSSFSSASFSKLPGQPSLIACKGLFLSFEFKSYCFSRYRERTTARLKIGRNRSKTAKNANKKQ